MGDKKDHHEIQDGRHAERERESPHAPDGEQVENRRGKEAHTVRGQDGSLCACPASGDRRVEAVAVPDFVL